MSRFWLPTFSIAVTFSFAPRLSPFSASIARTKTNSRKYYEPQTEKQKPRDADRDSGPSNGDDMFARPLAMQMDHNCASQKYRR
jgi:hypothetical protein